MGIRHCISLRKWESPCIQDTGKCRSVIKASLSPGHDSYYISEEASEQRRWRTYPKGARGSGKQALKHRPVWPQGPCSRRCMPEKAQARSPRRPWKAAGNGDSSARPDRRTQQNEDAVSTARFVSFRISYKSLDGSAKGKRFYILPLTFILSQNWGLSGFQLIIFGTTILSSILELFKWVKGEKWPY